VYAFLAPTRAVVGDIVREKELRLREGMRVLGLSEPAYWASWGLTHWTLLALSGALCAAAGTYPFANSSAAIMLAFFWLYAAALVSYSYTLSTLFTSSRVAGTAAQLLYALSMLPGFVLPAVYQYGSWTWYVACLSPPSAASLFAAALVNWEKVAE
ncbi:ATP-binding cassette sub-family A member 5, partial [Tetrabaena socialis]